MFIFDKQKISGSTNRGLDVSRNYNPDILSPEQMMNQAPSNLPSSQTTSAQQQQHQQQGPPRMSAATPTMQQRIKALGVATPIALSSPVRR